MKILLLNVFMLFGLICSGQSLFQSHYIGVHKSNVAELVKENQRALKLNTSNINKAYNYLKFEDNINEITALFFLNNDDVCIAVRIMGAYSNLNDIVEQLNKKYLVVDKNTWTYKVLDRTYQVELEKGDWFFTVSIKEKKED